MKLLIGTFLALELPLIKQKIPRILKIVMACEELSIRKNEEILKLVLGGCLYDFLVVIFSRNPLNC